MKNETPYNALTDAKSANFTIEELLLHSDLLAGMARADGKVLDIENVIASSYFEQENLDKSDLVKIHYDYVLHDEDSDTRLSMVMSFMSKLNLEDKHKLLRCLSAIAISDGELHPKELALIRQFAEAMGIDPNGL